MLNEYQNNPYQYNPVTYDYFDKQIGEISIISDDQVKKNSQTQLNCLQMKNTSLCSNTQIEEINSLAQKLGIDSQNEMKINQNQYGNMNQQNFQNVMPEFQKENIEMKMNFIDKIHQSLVNYNLNAPILYYQNSDNIVFNLNQSNQIQNIPQTYISPHGYTGLMQHDQQSFIDNDQKNKKKSSKKSKNKENISSKKQSEKKSDKKNKKENENKNTNYSKEIINSLNSSMLNDSNLNPIKSILKQEKKSVKFQNQPFKNNDYIISQRYSNDKQSDSLNSSDCSSDDLNQQDYDEQENLNYNTKDNQNYNTKDNSFSQIQKINRQIDLINSSLTSNSISNLQGKKYSCSPKQRKRSNERIINKKQIIDEDINQTKCKKQQKFLKTPTQSRDTSVNYYHGQLFQEEKQRELSVNQVQLSPLQKSFMNSTISSELRKSDRKSSCSNERSKSRDNSNNNRKSSCNTKKCNKNIKQNSYDIDKDKKSSYYQQKWLIDKNSSKKQQKNDIDIINALYEQAQSKRQQTQPSQKHQTEENNKKVNHTLNTSLRRNQTNNDESFKSDISKNTFPLKKQDKTQSTSSSFLQNYMLEDQHQSDHYRRRYIKNNN